MLFPPHIQFVHFLHPLGKAFPKKNLLFLVVAKNS
ncbi:CTP synthetase [Bacillus sp. NRRL B-14911]|nr:CTP synthetase [Bacillus sp. NRRL B-14911]